jgi:hypothetical protein
MATWVNYWRIITPASKKQQYTHLATDTLSNTNPNAVASISWYSQIMKGAGTRLQRYIQYEGMDGDVDVSRALDIIAEEISNDDERTGLPFLIEYQNEEDEEVSETIVSTLRAAVRHWARIQDLNNRIFRTARTMVKYGDCFFRKTTDFKKWDFVDPSKVLGIEINEKNERVAYHLKKGEGTVTVGGRNDNVEIVPADAIIHFSLSDEMEDMAPFGESVLQPIFRTFKQLSMLEDSTIIYQIVRAPERRVFYIDVGNMPQQRVATYLESIKNQIRQKRQPNTTAGKENVDGVYNPNSIQEDFFFPVTTSGRGSRVETLPGGENQGQNENLLYFQKKMFRGLRIPTSYMVGQDGQQAQYNDGKVGIAYIEELRFANFIKRLQNKLESVYDYQFKIYLNAANIIVNEELFLLKLPDPQNFALYRQAALDTDLINAFKSVEDVEYLSRRFILARYLGLTEDEIQMNEAMLKQERAIREDVNLSDLQQIYDKKVYENRPEQKVEEPEAEGGEEMGGGEPGGEEMGGMGGAPEEMGGGGAELPPGGPGGEENLTI